MIDAGDGSFSQSLAFDLASPGLWQWRQQFLARLLGRRGVVQACAGFAAPSEPGFVNIQEPLPSLTTGNLYSGLH